MTQTGVSQSQWASGESSEGTKRPKRDHGHQRDEAVSKASLHQKDVAIFLQLVKEDPLEFQEWIKQIRKEDFPYDFTDLKIDSLAIKISDFSKPINEIRTSRVCATLLRQSVCETRKCCRHVLCL